MTTPKSRLAESNNQSGFAGKLRRPPEQAWLVSDGQVMAALEIPVGWTSKAIGLLGRQGLNGAMVFWGARSVHSLGMKFDLDIAFLDSEMTVIKCCQLQRHRMTWPVPNASAVIEAELGAFERWGLSTGDVVEIRLVKSGETPQSDNPN